MQQLKQLTGPKNYDKFDQKITGRQFLLGKYYDTGLALPSCNGTHRNILNFPKSKIRRLLETQLKIHHKLKRPPCDPLVPGITPVDECQPDYQFYLPLNRLWRAYIQELVAKQTNQQSKELKILRSDFHGAHITVIGSKNETLVGLEGIVIKETLRSFEIITKATHCQSARTTKTILKSVCVFLIQVGEASTFIINGSSLVYRPSDRIRHRFKFKKSELINRQVLAMLTEAKSEDTTKS